MGFPISLYFLTQPKNPTKKQKKTKPADTRVMKIYAVFLMP